jgi:hypothetical protein
VFRLVSNLEQGGGALQLDDNAIGTHSGTARHLQEAIEVRWAVASYWNRRRPWRRRRAAKLSARQNRERREPDMLCLADDSARLIASIQIEAGDVFRFEFLDTAFLVHGLPAPDCGKSAANTALYGILWILDFLGHEFWPIAFGARFLWCSRTPGTLRSFVNAMPPAARKLPQG